MCSAHCDQPKFSIKFACLSSIASIQCRQLKIKTKFAKTALKYEKIIKFKRFSLVSSVPICFVAPNCLLRLVRLDEMPKPLR